MGIDGEFGLGARARKARLGVVTLTVLALLASTLVVLEAAPAAAEVPDLAAEYSDPMDRPASAGEYVAPPSEGTEVVVEPDVSMPPGGIESLPPVPLDSPPAPQPAPPNLGGGSPGEELVELRTPFTKTVVGDEPGEFTTISSPSPINYQDASGAWLPIDLSLTSDGLGHVRPTVGPVDLRLATLASAADLAKIEVGPGMSASFSLAGALPVPGIVDDAAVNYLSVLPAASLRLESTPAGVKEQLILASPLATNVFEFPLDLVGLMAAEEADGSIAYRDAAGHIQLRTPPGWAEDASGALAGGRGALTGDVDFDLVESAGGLRLRVTVDRAWLDDPARVDPVTVDPTWSVGAQANEAYYWVGSPSRPGRSRWGTRRGIAATCGAAPSTSPMRDCSARSSPAPTFACSTRGAAARTNPAAVRFLHATAFNFNGYDPGSEMCTTANYRADFDNGQALSQYSYAINNGIGGWALSFAGDESPGYFTYKKFFSFELHIDWMNPNSPPNPPDSMSPANSQLLRTWTPTLSSRGTDVDNNPLLFRVRVWRADNWNLEFADNDGQYRGQPATFAITTPTLPVDGLYYWESWTWDGLADSGHTGAYFRLDITPPSTPTGFSSPSHTTGLASTNKTVTVNWSPSTDAVAGVAGYAAAFGAQGADPGQSVNVGSPSITQTLADGTYWLNVRALDNAANPSPVATYGPFYIDGTAPLITKTVSGLTNGASYYARGQQLTYTITVTNTHAFPVNVNQVADTAPATLVPVAGSLLAGGAACAASAPSLPDPTFGPPSCTIAGQSISTSGFSLAASGQPGSSRTFTYRAVAVGADRDCSSVANAASATNGIGTTNATPATITVCDAGLGLEPWWTFVTKEAGPQSQAMVNPANGNLVVQAVDSTPIQGHGRIGYVLRRTYNSKSTEALALPGSLGAGWMLNIGQSDDLISDGAGATALAVPPAESFLSPAAVTLVDRDGTRHVFRPKGLGGAAAINATPGASTLTGAAAALLPKVLSVNTAQARICVDQTYTSPAGVHLGMWRYVAVQSTASNACATAAGANPTVLGFASVTTDRVRYEYNAAGKLVSMLDANGNELRYTYDALSRLSTVHEPRNCADPTPTTCRKFRFDYTQANKVIVYDPANRATTYELDTNTPARLTRVVNPDGTAVSYGYGTCNGSAIQLCNITDPRGNLTQVAYETQPGGVVGSRRVATLTDRRGTATGFNYQATYVNADQAGQRRRFSNIDATGRVGLIEEGNTSDVYRRRATYTWDTPAASCRQPNNGVDNNLCRTVRASLTTATPDQDTTYLYNLEGRLLRESRANTAVAGALTTVHDTSGYASQYVQADGTVRAATDDVAANATITSSAGARADGSTLYSLSDLTQTLPPRGNAAGAGFAAYRTLYKVDNNPAAAPNTQVTGSCASPAAPTSNTGNLCETVGPAFDGGANTITRHTYDNFGQKATTTTPKAIAETATGTPPAVTYTYYTDAECSLAAAACGTGTTSAGGWLKGVTDQHGRFVAFAYDRAGNVARTWDRNATAKALAADATKTLATYPGTVGTPHAGEYTEELRSSATGSAAFESPWRYVRSTTDQLGERTTVEAIDNNGNPLTVRPPRGNKAATNTFDVIATYAPDDRLLTRLLPEEKTANKKTEYTYDSLGNVTSETDPNGNVKVHLYDSVNRRTETRWTRGPWTTTPGVVPPACTGPTAAGDAPLPTGRIRCATTIAYDGLDNTIGASDPDAQTSTFVYDGQRRQLRSLTPRGDAALTSRLPDNNTTTLIRAERLYDADGNTTSACSPRQFATAVGEGNSAACTATAVFGEHRAYDVAGRVSTVTTYRQAGQPVVSTNRYDADGNVVVAINPNDKITTATYDLLDRRVSLEVPRSGGNNLATRVAETTRWLYDPAGNVTSVIRPGRLDLGTGADGDLVIDGAANPSANPYVLLPNKQYRNVTLQNGGWATSTTGTVAEIKAAGTVSICTNCGISLKGKGHTGGTGGGAGGNGNNGNGPGGGGRGTGGVIGSGGGGAGHAAAGAPGTALLPITPAGTGGAAYGATTKPETLSAAELLGSGGGGSGGGQVPGGVTGGSGGGAVHITASRIAISGAVQAGGNAGGIGADPQTSTRAGSGGGSGGTIWLTASSVETAGATLNVAGGTGGAATAAGSGGNGAAGRVYIDADTTTGSTNPGRPVGRITAYRYDAKHRLVETVDGADTTDAAQAGLTPADGGANIRTQVRYDADDHVVARFEPRAFAMSTSTPDAKFMARTDFDKNGRPTANYLPRYADGTAFDDPTGGSGGDQAGQCAKNPGAAAVAGVPDYPTNVGVCVSRVEYDFGGRIAKQILPTAADQPTATSPSPTPTTTSSLPSMRPRPPRRPADGSPPASSSTTPPAER